MSLFVSFEGGEGSGKSTQIEHLDGRLRDAGVPTMVVREPGTTSLGRDVRVWLKRERPEGQTVSGVTELLLFAAARAEMVSRVLKPALQDARSVVISDRYADSTVAYQGYGRGHDLEQVRVINQIATDGAVPDLTILLDCDPETGLARVQSVDSGATQNRQDEGSGPRFDPKGTRRFELEPLVFHRRVREGYQTMAKQEPDRWRVIDATGDAAEVAEAVWQHVSERLPS